MNDESFILFMKKKGNWQQKKSNWKILILTCLWKNRGM
jgi:hypothetical protein